MTFEVHAHGAEPRRVHILTLDAGDRYLYEVAGPVYRLIIGKDGRPYCNRAESPETRPELVEYEGCYVIPLDEPEERDDDAVF